MKAIFYKELRENLPWAGIILLITAGALITGLYNEFAMGMSILGRTFLTLCILVYPATGLAMGLLQVFQDSRRGRWQFITHRPMSVTKFLFAKWAAGILLYFLATAIPLGLVIAWVAAPGHVPGPFAWDMTEPVIAHLLSGLMWYAVGFLVAGRSARWLGSRVIPIGGAVAGAFAYNFFALTVIEAIGMIVLVTTLILFSAWGVFVGGGETSNVPKWTRPVTGLILLSGWLIVLGCTMGLCGQVIDMVWPHPQLPYSIYRFDYDGQVQVWNFDKGKVMKVEDLSGHELHSDFSNRTQLPIATLYLPGDEKRGGIWSRMDQSFLRPESHVTWLYNPSGAANWFYLSSSRTVKAYDPQTRWYLGSIGPSGFAGPQAPAQSFDQPMLGWAAYPAHSTLFTAVDSVYQLDTEHREVRKIFSTTLADPVQSANSLTVDVTLNNGDPAYFLVETRRALHVLQEAKPLMTVPVKTDRDGDFLTVGQTRNKQLIVGQNLQRAIGYKPASYSVYGMDGSLVSHTDLRSKALNTGYSRDDRVEEYSVLSLTPPGSFAVVLTLKQRPGDPVPWEPMGILLVASIGWTGVMFARLRARHARRGQMILWLLLAACLGLTGILLEMSMLKSVKSIRCLKCGKRRLISELQCQYCNTAADQPMMEGIEIFAMG